MNDILIFILSHALGALLLLCGIVLLWAYTKKHSDISDHKMYVLIALYAAIYSIMSLDAAHSWGGDFAEYIAQARAICEGTIAKQVENNTFIIEHSSKGLGPSVYPWGFPLILSPFYALFGENLIALKIPGVISMIAFSVYCYRLSRLHFTVFQSYILTMCFVTTPSLLFWVNDIQSDMLFLCLSTVLLWYIIRLFEERDTRKLMINAIIIGILMFWACNTRTNGIVIVLTLFLMQIIQCIRRNKLYIPAHILPYILLATGSAIISIALPVAAKDHVNMLINTITVHSITQNILYYARITARFFPYKGYMSIVVYAIFALLFFYGFCRNFIRNNACLIYSIYIAGTLSMYILWPYKQGLRFLAPILPFFAIFAGWGIKDIAPFIPNRMQKGCAKIGMFLMLLLACHPVFGRIIFYRNTGHDAYTSDTYAMYKYIRENTKTSDIVIFFKPRVLYLETGRLSFNTSDISRLHEGQYLLLVKDKGAFSYNIETQYPQESKALFKVKENDTLTLYKINKQ